MRHAATQRFWQRFISPKTLRRAAGLRQGTALLLLVLIIASTMTLIYSAASFKTQSDALSVADSDNQGWIVSQLDTNHRGLLWKLMQSQTPSSEAGTAITEAELAMIRKAFDIYYSRVTVVQTSLDKREVAEPLAGNLVWLTERRETLAQMIDAIDTPDPVAIAELTEAFVADTELVRDISVDGLLYFVRQTAVAREAQQALYEQFRFKAFIITAFMVLASLLAIKLWRDLESRSRVIARNAVTVTRAFDAAFSGVIVTDEFGRIERCNKATEAILGAPQEALAGTMLAQFVNPETFDRKFKDVEDDARPMGSDPTPQQGLARRASGDTFHAEVSASGKHDIGGRKIQIVYISDISDRIAAEGKLRQARDEARDAAEARSMFLATMSHEMRTPLHGLIASLDMIDADRLNEADRQLFKTARDCSDRTLAQVNDVLDLSRLGNGKEPMTAFSPARIITEIADELRPLAQERENLLDVEFLGEGPLGQYVGLPTAFSRAIYNLIGNAINFTQHGKISVTLTGSAASSDGARSLMVCVSDNGVGIAPEDQRRIFDLFETGRRPDGATGSGLGLVITRTAIEKMGSAISLESKPGRGSHFSFELHLKAVHPKSGKSAEAPLPASLSPRVKDTDAISSPEPAALNVLVVDDNQINRTVLCEMLERIGHTTAGAASGHEALVLCGDTAYDVILMDVSMPGMDGHEAARRIVDADTASSNALILGVTALVTEDSFHQQGAMHAVLAKPLTRSRLENALKVHSFSEPLARTLAVADAPEANANGSLRDRAWTDVVALQDILTEGALSPDALADRVHYTIGSAAVTGLTEVADILRSLENALRDGSAARTEKHRQRFREYLRSAVPDFSSSGMQTVSFGGGHTLRKGA